MKHSSVLLGMASALLIAGCMPAAPADPQTPPAASSSSAPLAMESNALTISLEKAMTEDAEATLHTKASLRLSGAIDDVIDLDDILGDLLYVDPKAYGVYARPNGQTVAVLTAWWAGQGEEIVITQMTAPPSLVIEHRYGDESGECTEAEVLAKYPLTATVRVSLDDFGDPTPQSRIQFCSESKAS